MEQFDKKLKHTLIQQYSKLSFRNSIELSERVKENDWWIRETYRLKVQSNISKIGFWFAIIMVGVIFIISFKVSGNFWQISIPFLSTFLFVFSLGLLIKTVSQVGEKLRLFELMKLVFNIVVENDSII